MYKLEYHLHYIYAPDLLFIIVNFIRNQMIAEVISDNYFFSVILHL